MVLVGGGRVRSLFAVVGSARGRNPAPSRKRTWAEKITDDLNVWLEARRLEVEGDLLGAAGSYAQDKDRELERGNDARAALSAGCEARCLARLGLDPAPGFATAARLYARAAWVELRGNPRAALQLFERARECYELSKSTLAAREVASVTEAIRRALDFRGPDRPRAEEVVAKRELDLTMLRGQARGPSAPIVRQPLP
jgi:hypothetical protein